MLYYKMRFRKAVFILVIISVFSLRGSLLLSEEPQAGKVVMRKIEEALAILHDLNLQSPEKKLQRKHKLWQALSPVFDFETISRKALGPYWRNLTSQQREDFLKVFTEILKNIYLNKTDTYAGEKIVYLREYTINNRSKVQTNFITKEGKRLSVDFSMHKKNNAWLVYDVIVEGVSVVANYRNQFNSILTNSSFVELMQKLKEKEKKLSQLKGGE